MPIELIKSLGFKISPELSDLLLIFQKSLLEYMKHDAAIGFARFYAGRACDVALTRRYPKIAGLHEIEKIDIDLARLSDVVPKRIVPGACKHRKDDISYLLVFSGDAERLKMAGIAKVSELATKGYTPGDVVGSIRTFIEKENLDAPQIWFEYLRRKAEIWIALAKIYAGLL